MEYISQSRPDSGLGVSHFQCESFKIIQVVPSPLAGGGYKPGGVGVRHSFMWKIFAPPSSTYGMSEFKRGNLIMLVTKTSRFTTFNYFSVKFHHLELLFRRVRNLSIFPTDLRDFWEGARKVSSDVPRCLVLLSCLGVQPSEGEKIALDLYHKSPDSGEHQCKSRT